MGNKKFTVGYNGNFEDLKRILEYSDNMVSVYTGGLSGRIGGGRPQYIDNLQILARQIEYAHRKNVEYEIALNAPCGIDDFSNKEWWDYIKKYIKELENHGVDSIIASHPFVIDVVKSKTNMTVVVSTICEIKTVRSILYYEKIGGDIIIPSMEVNYNGDVLSNMRKKLKKARLRIMVNEHCLGDCPWRRFHHNHYSHSNNEYFYHLKCKSQFINNPYLLLTNNVIRPEDLKHYELFTDEFKIVGRLVPIDDLLSRIKCYIDESFEGNYVALSDAGMAKKFYMDNSLLNELFNNKNNCGKLCDECGYCIELSDRHLKIS